MVSSSSLKYHHPSPSTLESLIYKQREFLSGLDDLLKWEYSRELSYFVQCLRECGVFASRGVSIQRNHADSGGKLKGVWRCHKRTCPVCGYLIEQRERQNLREAFRELENTRQLAGSTLYDGAITLRHSRADDPRELMKAISEASSALLKSPWFRDGARGGVFKLEVSGRTEAANGLHPHAHFVFAVSDDVPAPAFFAKVEAFFAHRLGSDRVQWSPGWYQCTLSTDTLSGYLAKRTWSVAEEVTLSLTGKDGSYWLDEAAEAWAKAQVLAELKTFRGFGTFRAALRAVKAGQPEPRTKQAAFIPREVWKALDQATIDGLHKLAAHRFTSAPKLRLLVSKLQDDPHRGAFYVQTFLSDAESWRTLPRAG